MVPVIIAFVVLLLTSIFWFLCLIEQYKPPITSWLLFLMFVIASSFGMIYDYQCLGITKEQKTVFFVEDVAVVKTCDNDSSFNSLLELSKKTGRSYKAGDKVNITLINNNTKLFDWCMSYRNRIKSIEKVEE